MSLSANFELLLSFRKQTNILLLTNEIGGFELPLQGYASTTG